MFAFPVDEYQALGYPILSIRSIPKDPAWLARFYKDDLDRKFIETPLSITAAACDQSESLRPFQYSSG